MSIFKRRFFAILVRIRSTFYSFDRTLQRIFQAAVGPQIGRWMDVKIPLLSLPLSKILQFTLLYRPNIRGKVEFKAKTINIL